MVRRERDLGAHQVEPRPAEGVVGPLLGHSQQCQGRVERTRLEFGLGGIQRASSPIAGIRRQLGRAFQERSGRGESTAGLGPAGGALELTRHLLVGPHRRVGAMPRATIGICDGVAGLSQRPMDLPAVG